MSSLPRDCGGFQPVKGGGGYGGGGGGHGWGGVSGQFIGGVSSGPAGVVGGYEGVGGGHGGGVVDGDSGSGMVVGEVMVGTGGFDGSVVQDMVQELVSAIVVVAVLATLLAPVIGDLFLVAVVVDLVGQVVLSMLDMVMVTATGE